VTWGIERGPVFANSVGRLDFAGSEAALHVEQVEPYDAATPPSLVTAFCVDL
jgi:hypothetical protein